LVDFVMQARDAWHDEKDADRSGVPLQDLRLPVFADAFARDIGRLTLMRQKGCDVNRRIEIAGVWRRGQRPARDPVSG
jgi:hypothetical protein